MAAVLALTAIASHYPVSALQARADGSAEVSLYPLVYEPAFASDGKLRKLKVEAFQIVDDQRRDFTVRVCEGWRS
jgi:hypothetical protein